MDEHVRGYVAGLTMDASVPGGTKPYINLDNAASTPPFASVLKAVNDAALWYSSVHRGSGFKSRLSTEAYERAHQTIGQFVGADPTEHTVIFGKNTTEAINKLSYRLRFGPKDIILISHAEHHSNDLPWRARATVKRIGIAADGSISQASFMALLGQYAGRVKLVALTGASNVTGHLPDIYWFARQAHAAGADILVDCAQLAAHHPIKMGRLHEPEHLDYIAMSAHKMYAPFGTGALIGRRDTFATGAPEYSGGGTIRSVTTRSVDWAPTPDRDEAGSPNVLGAIAMAQAATTLQEVGFDTIAKRETALTEYALAKLSQLPGIQLYGSQHAAGRSAVIPFTVQNVPAQLVAAILGYEWGIGVRSGCFCAQPYVMSLLGIQPAAVERIRLSISQNDYRHVPGMVRISLGFYNTTADIDAFIGALQQITAGAYSAYDLDSQSGSYIPAKLLIAACS